MEETTSVIDKVTTIGTEDVTVTHLTLDSTTARTIEVTTPLFTEQILHKSRDKIYSNNNTTDIQ